MEGEWWRKHLLVADTSTFCSYVYTGCPTRYRSWHEDTATKFEQEYVRCVRNEEECVCSAPNCCDMEQWSTSNILISGKIIKEMPGSVASGTHCTNKQGSEMKMTEGPRKLCT